ncbi:dUTP diphosphatase [Caloranaerobacter sp. DY30410]|uniref:dUTP diphosphatase n=1 Tax=Caloranaerobacter sp. DY30410 TaxID=3238305 RepID=UPI003CFFFF26
MRIKPLDNNCIPYKKYISDAGWDLKKSREKITLVAGETKVIPTGVCVEIPKGYSGDIRPRSSISKRGLLIHYGTVDHGYTGEIKLTVTNLTGKIQTIEQYERIAQLVLTKISNDTEIEIIDEFEETERGKNGFGSTGRL